MVDSGTLARDICTTSAFVSGFVCPPPCAKAASPNNRSGIAHFMVRVLLLLQLSGIQRESQSEPWSLRIYPAPVVIFLPSLTGSSFVYHENLTLPIAISDKNIKSEAIWPFFQSRRFAASGADQPVPFPTPYRQLNSVQRKGERLGPRRKAYLIIARLIAHQNMANRALR